MLPSIQTMLSASSCSVTFQLAFAVWLFDLIGLLLGVVWSPAYGWLCLISDDWHPGSLLIVCEVLCSATRCGERASKKYG